MNDEQIESLSRAITHLAYGGKYGPTGFEALCMALVGGGTPGTKTSVAESLGEIALAISDLAEAIRETQSNQSTQPTQ